MNCFKKSYLSKVHGEIIKLGIYRTVSALSKYLRNILKKAILPLRWGFQTWETQGSLRFQKESIMFTGACILATSLYSTLL